jgi:hypothetical protein
MIFMIILSGGPAKTGDGIQLIDQDNLKIARVLNIYRNILLGRV